MKENLEVMGVITAIVILFVGLMVVYSVMTSVEPYSQTYYVVNETNTSAIGSGTIYTLANAGLTNFYMTNTSIIITNSTTVWTTTNYTAFANGTVIFGAVNASLLDTAYFTYEYDATPAQYNTMYTNAETMTGNAFILLAAGIIVMVSVMILAYFGFGKKK